MATTNTVHELTSAEISRQIRRHSERRQEIVNERADIYASAMKNGGSFTSPIADADELAARAHAKALLNGSAPDFLSLPPETSREKILYREQRGIDIALKVLTDKDIAARAAEAVEWAEANGERWRTLCREITLTAVKLEALERNASELLDQCGDVFAIRLPMSNIVGARPVSEMSVRDLTEAALTSGVVTGAEIRKAKSNVS